MRQYEHAIIDLKANQYIEEDVTLFHLQLRSIPLPHAPQHPFHIGPRIGSSKNGNKTILIPRRAYVLISTSSQYNIFLYQRDSGHAFYSLCCYLWMASDLHLFSQCGQALNFC